MHTAHDTHTSNEEVKRKDECVWKGQREIERENVESADKNVLCWFSSVCICI